jgi:hypothetical protein
MREVTLGYDLPRTLLAESFLTSVRVSLVGRNLFFFQNKAEYVDPEIMMGVDNTDEGQSAFPLPTVRTYGISVNFGF